MNRLAVGTSVLCLALVALTASLASARKETTDNGEIAALNSLEAALNAHDSELALVSFASTASVQDVYPPQTSEQVDGWVEELVRQQIHLEPIDQPSVSGNEVTGHVWLDMQMYRDVGLAYVPGTVRATVVAGKITFLSIRPDPGWTSQLADAAIT